MAGRFFSSLIRLYILPLSHMSTSMNKIVRTYQTVIMLYELLTFLVAPFKMVVHLMQSKIYKY